MSIREEVIKALDEICLNSECTPEDCELYEACESHDKLFTELDTDALKEIYAKYVGVDDAVNQPNHYTVGGIEVIDYFRAKLTLEEYRGYCKGNVLKYLSRAGHKDDEAQEYRKAKKYMEWLCETYEA